MYMIHLYYITYLFPVDSLAALERGLHVHDKNEHTNFAI